LPFIGIRIVGKTDRVHESDVLICGLNWIGGKAMVLMFLKETFELRDVFSHCRSGGIAKSNVVAFGKSGCHDGFQTVRILETFPDFDSVVRTKDFRFGGRLLDCPHGCFMCLGMIMPPSFDILLLFFLKAFESRVGKRSGQIRGSTEVRTEIVGYRVVSV